MTYCQHNKLDYADIQAQIIIIIFITNLYRKLYDFDRNPPTKGGLLKNELMLYFEHYGSIKNLPIVSH